MAIILDGKKLRDKRAEELKNSFLAIGYNPTLSILLVGENEESQAYINQKIQFGEKVGVEVELIKLPESSTTEDLIAKIEDLNTKPSVAGIIVQMPLPKHIDKFVVLDAVATNKDVDGLTSENLGKFFRGEKSIVPATARGVMTLLSEYGVEVAGKKVLIIGRSFLVGKPLLFSFINKDATATLAHSKTKDLQTLCRQADILISAVGKKNFITSEFVKDGQVIVDVGISVEEINGIRKLYGDVAYEEVKDIVHAISPVPGGVGPMTVLSLYENLRDLVI